ncbi:MAG: GNAT family N-acetyltransferase [Candidatus Magasanikbacteria bacterium RIFOXYC2_FULL_40_16]|uniref:GNAT family N-acetyltransferase n=3 Tax=Candidatus Magasanikiibacteriota TaxID=1752731 RepID=A0A1F6NE01_9BACT|nr:MAG: GNAT family N-acetyltransferase [Candidatus Magasanikbacteria bacterium RIFOXYA2_FULL_40_20]OGH82061.1 MAG: GNAT family N-acetyltransferase [Candidatus Magasanikbacteria bacterium RIFOXYB1_FULL_40_15]OGH85076.1 MAG: GNAT family N-acetyltransferase [Candidatus Magasanikbacteria bacterium RIFOXYB2_FULL_40_13]OGH87679.1 MAG: GNAT family N-acetyltransferase [Candidatus Magasanikbacteria bacterium RIFOXYA1_FULL_40_8]OGH90258.1 MAG: GNAT family N-acetyltransferase [Candidatus Magasanikbacteri
MNFKKQEENNNTSIKIECEVDGKIMGHAYLYIIKNDLHDRPYGLLEDLFVEEEYRGQGIGKKILNEALEEAKKNNCYKLISQSRYERTGVHEFYKKNGLTDYGKNFRINL